MCGMCKEILGNQRTEVGFEVVFTVVIMKAAIFWDVTPYSSVEVN